MTTRALPWHRSGNHLAALKAERNRALGLTGGLGDATLTPFTPEDIALADGLAGWRLERVNGNALQGAWISQRDTDYGDPPYAWEAWTDCSGVGQECFGEGGTGTFCEALACVLAVWAASPDASPHLIDA